MKNILILLVCNLSVTVAYGQQEQHYTQFMYNKLGYNPGYAGSKEAPCLTGIYRNQWLGLEGAPKTQVLSYAMPLMNNRVGVGLNLTRNTIGISERVTIDGTYAYRVNVGRGMLGLGVQASVRFLGIDYSDPRLKANQLISVDGAIPAGNQSKYLPNFGVGLYYNTQTFYFGVSAPRLLQNNIDFSSSNTIIGTEVLHVYGMAGLILPLGEKVDFYPQVLLKYAEASPFDADVNLSLVFQKKYTAGLTYRIGGSNVTGAGESIDLMIGAQLTDNILFGASYDITLSEIKDYSSGSVELMLRYCFGNPEGSDFVNPRFF